MWGYMDTLLQNIPEWRDQAGARLSAFPLSLLRWELILLFLIIVFVVIYHRFKSGKQVFTKFWNSFILLFEMMFEKIYDFFIEIIGEHQKYWVKSFVIWMFFVILFSNLMGTLLDFVGIAFPGLEEWIIAPTTDANFNIAMAVVSVLLILYLQMKHLWVGKFFYEYVPLFWKNIITIERGTMPKLVYYPLWLFAKLFDILISLFVGALDIIGNFAKVISLSFRLTGNDFAGDARDGTQSFDEFDDGIRVSNSLPFDHRIAGGLGCDYPGFCICTFDSNLYKGCYWIVWEQLLI